MATNSSVRSKPVITATLAVGLILMAGSRGWAASFPGVGTGAIPDRASAGCGPPSGPDLDITFEVNSVGVPLSEVSLSIEVNHTWVGDLDARLIAPDGTTHVIFADTGATTATACGSSDNLDGTYFFDDSQTGDWWSQASPYPPGGYRTTVEGRQSAPPAGDPTLMTAAFSHLSSVQVNDTWILRVNDSGGGDTGSITAASLTLNPSACHTLVLEHDTVVSSIFRTACGTVTLGPNYVVMGPDGHLIVRSGTGLEFQNGFEVGIDGRLEAGIDPSLNPSMLALEASRAMGETERARKPQAVQRASPRGNEKLKAMQLGTPGRSIDP